MRLDWCAGCISRGRWQSGSGDAMKALRQMRVAVAAVIGTVFAVQAMGQAAETKQQAVAAPAHKRVIVVSLEDHKLALVEDGQVKKVYTVAVGKPSTPSPVGTFAIER